ADPQFVRISTESLGVVYPSCSEGQCGSVVTCLHAGLIPVVSRETGVDVDPAFGVVLADCSVEGIRRAIAELSGRPTVELEAMRGLAWEFARSNHTRERFAQVYSGIVTELVREHAGR